MNLKKYQEILVEVAQDLIEDGYSKDDIATFRETAFLMVQSYHPELENFIKKIYGPRAIVLDIITNDIYKQVTGVKNGRTR